MVEDAEHEADYRCFIATYGVEQSPVIAEFDAPEIGDVKNRPLKWAACCESSERPDGFMAVLEAQK